MTTDENILEEMLERFTSPNSKDQDDLAMQMFLMVVKSNAGVVTKAHELIIRKIYSPNINEANRAIGLLEECMSNAGEEFQKRTATYKFLNNLTALVLDKHTGPKAPVETKKRVMECLMLWTVEHPDKEKIIKVYDNNAKEVSFDLTPTTMAGANTPNVASNNAKEQRASILGKDDQLVAKLLKEGGEENYKKANLVIQHRFNQEARRTEFICHLKSELKKIDNTIALLNEMLNSYSTDTPGAESCEIMRELYNNCEGHNEQMARWPDFLGDTEPEFLDDILITKDLLIEAIHRYEDLFEIDTVRKVTETLVKPITQTTKNTNSIPPSTTQSATNTDLLSELLGDNLSSSSLPKSDETKKPSNIQPNALDELSELFGSIETSDDKTNYPSDLLENLDLLEPISVFEAESSKEDDLEKTETNGDEDSKKPQGFKELREIDKLSEEMFKQSLQTELRQTTFKKESEKITLNDLAKDKIQSSLKPKNDSGKKSSMDCKNNIEIDNELQDKKDNKHVEKDEIIDQAVAKVEEKVIAKDFGLEKETAAVKEETNEKTKASDLLPLKPLAEITIDLDDVTPLQEGHRILFDDDDIQVLLNFTEDRPSAHVSVIVVSVNNKSKLPVKDFQFEASVRKPCKVRLLPPTGTSMAPAKPFRPSAPINQIILLLNPTQKSADLTCIISYKLGDDPDPITDSVLAKDIPYV